jgi:hypothetical protein
VTITTTLVVATTAVSTVTTIAACKRIRVNVALNASATAVDVRICSWQGQGKNDKQWSVLGNKFDVMQMMVYMCQWT